ncbi:MAG: hypothetical protein HQK99_12090 [Nitrospirae bacterium]|nr:hypothetical protein [Nitrospirota bacterium]
MGGFICNSWYHGFSENHRRLCNAIEAVGCEIDYFYNHVERKKTDYSAKPDEDISPPSEVIWEDISPRWDDRKKYDYSVRLDSAKCSLRLAEQELKRRDYKGGWLHLHNAKRELLFLLDHAALRAKLTIQRQEAGDKLASWRLQAYNDLDLGVETSDSNVAEAQKLLDEYANDRWLKIRILQSQIWIISSVIVLVVISIIFLGRYFNHNLFVKEDDIGVSLPEWLFLLVVALFGVLGASFSGARSVANEKAKESIPDQIESNSIIIMRLIVGSASALAVHCFLRMGLAKILTSNAASYYGVSFVVGFSERLVVRAVEKISDKLGPDAKDKTKKGT